MNTNVSSNSEQQNQSSHPPIRSFYNLQRLKDLKLNGSIRRPGREINCRIPALLTKSKMGELLGFQKLKFVPGL